MQLRTLAKNGDVQYNGQACVASKAGISGIS